jgi:hypothetical protein
LAIFAQHGCRNRPAQVAYHMAATVRRCVRDLVHEVDKAADAEADPGVDLDSARAAARHADRVFRHAEAEWVDKAKAIQEEQIKLLKFCSSGSAEYRERDEQLVAEAALLSAAVDSAMVAQKVAYARVKELEGATRVQEITKGRQPPAVLMRCFGGFELLEDGRILQRGVERAAPPYYLAFAGSSPVLLNCGHPLDIQCWKMTQDGLVEQIGSNARFERVELPVRGLEAIEWVKALRPFEFDYGRDKSNWLCVKPHPYDIRPVLADVFKVPFGDAHYPPIEKCMRGHLDKEEARPTPEF